MAELEERGPSYGGYPNFIHYLRDLTNRTNEGDDISDVDRKIIIDYYSHLDDRSVREDYYMYLNMTYNHSRFRGRKIRCMLLDILINEINIRPSMKSLKLEIDQIAENKRRRDNEPCCECMVM
jgi:hypothetical protein